MIFRVLSWKYIGKRIKKVSDRQSGGHWFKLWNKTVEEYFFNADSNLPVDKRELQVTIKYCCKGETRAQEKLYKMFYNYGMSIALRYAHDRFISGEIYNDSFMKIFKNLDKYDVSKNFKSWLRQIIIHTAIDTYRKELKHNNQNELAENEEKLYHTDVIDKLNADDIIRLVQSLPHLYRIVFNMYEVEGYRHEEIARTLNIAQSTSRSCLTRAKSKLRQLFMKNHEIKI